MTDDTSSNGSSEAAHLTGLDQRRNLPVDRRSKTHLYLQIYQYIVDQIYTGVYQDNQPIPSENELIAQFNISRITARRTVDELVQAGLAKRGRGRRTVVNYQGYRQPMQAPIDDFLDSLYLLGKSTSVELLGFEYTSPTEEVTQRLRLPPESLVQQAIRVRTVNSEPLLHIMSFVPEDIGRLYTAEDLSARPLNELLRMQGIKIASAEQSVGATLALVDTASLLKVPAGSALVRMRRVLFDETGRPVEYVIVLGHGDTFEFKMSMKPRPSR